MNNNPAHCKNCNAELIELMNYCPNCGKEKFWNSKNAATLCPRCNTSINKGFNYCCVCGEDVYPDGQHEPKTRAAGFRLEHECSNGCKGSVQEFMTFCPWCGRKQKWKDFYDSRSCSNCEVSLMDEWYYCVFCGKLIDKGDPQSWARKGGYLRPFNALVEMPKEHRDNLRESLNFSWSKQSLADSHYQAKEILNCDLRGIIARVHSTGENLFRIGSNVTWREIILRCLDENIIKYPAHLSESDLEIRLLDGLLTKKISDIKHEVRKVLNSNKVNENILQNPAEIMMIAFPILFALNFFGVIPGNFLQIKRSVALSAVMSICLWLHPSFIDLSAP